MVKRLFIQKRVEKNWKNEKSIKEIEDEIHILGHKPMQIENEIEITMEVNNQNRLKQTDKVLKDNIKKEIKVLEDNIRHTKKKKKKHLKD